MTSNDFNNLFWLHKHDSAGQTAPRFVFYVCYFCPAMRRYPAKLLLFGEHVVLLGAPALAVPITRFGGQWAWRDPAATLTERDRRLREFAGSAALGAVPGLDAGAFVQDLERGLFFDSDISDGLRPRQFGRFVRGRL